MPAEDVSAQGRLWRSAGKLAQVQVITMALGLLTRMYMPRALGVEKLGLYYFAEAFPVLYFAWLSCGVDAYIRKTLPQKPAHVKDLSFSVLVFELGLALVIGVVLFVSLQFMSYDGETIALVMVMGGYAAFLCIHRVILKQIFLSLHEYRLASHVELAIKIGGTLLILVLLLVWPSPMPVAWVLFLGEVLGAVALTRELWRRGWLVPPVDKTLLKRVLLASLPFLATSLFTELYANVDAAMLGRMVGNIELGFYGAATRLRGVFLMFLPIMSNALMPIMAETFGKSREHYLQLVKEAMRAVLVLAFWLTVTLMAFSDVATLILSGKDYAPSARIVAYLAPILPLTYVAVLIAVHLTIATTGRLQALIQCLTVGSNALLNWYMIPYGLEHWGVGGAGVGSAFASLITQACGVLAMMFVTRSDLHLMDRSMARFFVANTLPVAALLFFYNDVMAVPLLPRLAVFLPAVALYTLASRMVRKADIERLQALWFGRIRRTIE